jgi:putative inorganic carbon (HCO3(-)) transporter
MSRMWWYTLSVLVLWIVNPELRRLHDWAFGFSQVEIISLLPLVSLGPHVWSLTMGGGWKRLPPAMAMAAWCWIGGFLYAFLLALLNGNLFAGTYSFLTFVVPIGLGLWVAADQTPMSVSYVRITKVLFGLTTILSVYGIIQYVFLPPWDAFWLQNVSAQGALSFGKPFPYQVRVFSMLNSPGPFGSFMACMLLMSFPTIGPPRTSLLAQMPFWLIAFGLSLDRSGWLMFAVGLFVFVCLSPRPAMVVTMIAASTALLAILLTVLPGVIGNDMIFTSINDRLGSFSSLESDDSAEQRQALIGNGLEDFLSAPLGRGLGITGTSAKLGEAGATLDYDNGFLARLIEMGVPGSLLYGSTFAVMFFALLRLWRRAKRNADAAIQGVAAMAIGLEFALLSLLVSGDVSGLLVLLLWLLVCMAVQDGRRPAAVAV